MTAIPRKNQNKRYNAQKQYKDKKEFRHFFSLYKYMPITEGQRASMMKWRANNKEKYLKMQRGYQKKYYDEHSAKILEYKRAYYENVLKPKKESSKSLPDAPLV